MLAAGCTGSKDNSASQTSSPQSTEAVYQDNAWRLSIHKYTGLLRTDFENVRIFLDNTNNSDYASLAAFGQNITDHSQAGIRENNQYNVSPQFRDAQKEWGLVLEDSNSAGKSVIMISNDIKNGNTSSKMDNIQKYIEHRSSMTVHLNETTTLLQNADKTTK
jgi:hypothetical protein